MSNDAHRTLLAMKGQLAKGWIQNDLVGPDGVCLMGACLVAVAGDEAIQGLSSGPEWRNWWNRTPFREPLRAVADAIGSRSLIALSTWNDLPGRTANDVVAVVDQALASTAPVGA